MSSRSAERAPGREHIPIYPKGFATVRILQLVLAVVCLGLTAYVVAVLPITGAALMLFTAIVSLGTSIYLVVAHFGPTKSYNYWAIMALDIFHVLFWLISFGLLAAQAAVLFAYGDGYYYGYSDYFSILGAIAAAAAGLGAVQWILYLVALIIHSIALHRHRKAGLHSSPGGVSTGPNQAVAGAPAGPEKYQMQPQQPQAYYPPPSGIPQDGSPQPYQQQPPYQQSPYQQPPYEQHGSPSPYQQQPYQQEAYQQSPYQQQPEQQHQQFQQPPQQPQTPQHPQQLQ